MFNLFKGALSNVEAVLTITLIVAALFIGVRFVMVSKELANLKTIVASTQAINKALAEESAANLIALHRREAETTRLDNEISLLKLELENIYAEDEESKNWASICVPSMVLDKLRSKVPAGDNN